MDKPALTKDRSIWIAIRVLGFIFALEAIRPLFQLVGSLITVILIGFPPYLPSTLCTQLVLFEIILTDSVIILVTLYLLFFAKRIHSLIDKTTHVQDEKTCLSKLLATIAVRTFGVWFIIKGIITLATYPLSIINFLVINNLISKGLEDGSVSSNEFFEKLLNNGIPKVTITVIITVLGCALGAFYFLKYGKLVIRLLTYNRKSSG